MLAFAETFCIESKYGNMSIVEPSELTQKSKSCRYNLKKLLDRTRFSPKANCFPRLTKSVQCENSAELTCSAPMIESFEIAPSPVVLDSSVSVAKNQYTPTPSINSTANHESLVIEEEYEESLSHFTDLIIEGLSTKSSDTMNHLGFPAVHKDALSTSGVLSGGKHQSNIERTKLMNHSPARIFYPGDFMTARDHQSIYNEPCDAKSTTGIVVEAPPEASTTIYTSEPLHRERSRSRPPNTSSSSDSSLSSDGQVPVDSTNCRVIHSQGGFPNSEPVLISPSKQRSGARQESRSSAIDDPDQHSRQNPGFVDSPRGNSGIIHHSTSAFARVPKGISPERFTGFSLRDQPDLVSTSSKTTCASAPRYQNDSHATYEEAWDVKMTRQLGFGIPQFSVTPSEPSTTTMIHNPVPHRSLHLPGDVSTDVASSQHCKPVPRSETNGVASGASETLKRAPDHACLATPGNSAYHNNRAYDENHSEDSRGTNEKAEPPVEYDYAYNGSWCKGVQLNMKLAINGAANAVPGSSSAIPAKSSVAFHSPNPSLEPDLNSAPNSGNHCNVRRSIKTSQLLSTTKKLTPNAMNKRSPNSIARFKTAHLSASLESLPLEAQPWYHPSLTRHEAEDLLADEPEGTFLVRNSETCLNDYSLTIKHKIFVHMKISRKPTGQYILGDYSQPYPSVPQMIYHYARTLVPVRGAEYVTLNYPFCRPIVTDSFFLFPN